MILQVLKTRMTGAAPPNGSRCNGPEVTATGSEQCTARPWAHLDCGDADPLLER